jgi:hypothetical protein
MLTIHGTTKLTELRKLLQSQSQVSKSLTLLQASLVHAFPYARGEYIVKTAIVTARNPTAAAWPMAGYCLKRKTLNR